MSNSIDVEESTLTRSYERTFIVSAYIQKLDVYTPHDTVQNAYVYQFVMAMVYSSGNVERYGSPMYSVYDEAVLAMNEKLKEFYDS
tara:strand:- start:785 stop:1042 length:258 start_codon:yes stop_codon:yes gene_type:complete